MKARIRWFALIIIVLIMQGGSPLRAYAAKGEPSFCRIFHLDCGRRYFEKSSILNMIDTLAENNYTHLELAVGNDGLRFLLDDMSVTVGSKTYSSAQVTEGIKKGNKTYFDQGKNELTESEMNSIISYARNKGIRVIPLVNSPGHMATILRCMDHLGMDEPRFLTSKQTLDITNEEASLFTQELIKKYIAYFAAQGADYFNMGCDEYGSDIGKEFGELINRGSYGTYAAYVNKIAADVKKAGMIPVAFNDGFYFKGTDAPFDKDIVIAFWSRVYGGRQAARTLVAKGFKILNTNQNWYALVGNYRNFYPKCRAGIENDSARTLTTGATDVPVIGAMICYWGDNPAAVTYAQSDEEWLLETLALFAQKNPDEFRADDPGIPDVHAVTLDLSSASVLTADSDKLPNVSDSTLALTAEIIPRTALNKKISWKSSNNSVAEVDSNGVITGKAPGTATITVTTEDGKKTASCRVTVLRRKEYKLTAGGRYRMRSRLNKGFCMDVTRVTTDKNTNVSLYKYDAPRYAQRFLVQSVMVSGNTYYALTIPSNGRAVTVANGNLVQGVYKKTNWQLFRVYRFSDGSVQLINRANNKAVSVVGGQAAMRADIRVENASLDARQRWYGEKIS